MAKAVMSDRLDRVNVTECAKGVFYLIEGMAISSKAVFIIDIMTS
jgi:hypothetical protein